MISTDELARLLGDIESDRVERTSFTSDTDKFAKAITAFSNDLSNSRQPGYLLIGVDNAGTLSGLSVTDGLLQNLAALRSDGNIQAVASNKRCQGGHGKWRSRRG